mgnify:CR=1 FL=1
MESQFGNRKYIIGGFIVLTAVVIIVKLFFFFFFYSSYYYYADAISTRKVIQYPARGLIFDRNGQIIVSNEASYDLMVIYKQTHPFDTLAICNLLKIKEEQFVDKFNTAKNKFPYIPYCIMENISVQKYAELQEVLHEYPGFFVQIRTIRKYPQKIAGHILGYVGEVDTSITNNSDYYIPGDYIGISGIEKYYEKTLRGEKGEKYYMVDKFNRIKGPYANGSLDKPSSVGQSITLTIDAELQKYGERLMKHKKGSIVAIEPKTGEILAMLSAPGYDPNLLVGRQKAHNYFLLEKDSLQPLFNRAVMAKYPPGSIFKIMQALIGLQEGVITENTGFRCDRSIIGCHNHPTATNLLKGIQYSCNPYFYKVYQRIIMQGKEESIFKDSETGYKIWRDYVMSFGLGKTLKIDLPNVKGGLIPTAEFYDKWYGNGRWAFSTIYSNGIGQGEIEIVPVQMANLSAIFANKGYYHIPHLVKKIGKKADISPKFKVQQYTKVDSKHFNIITEAMHAVVSSPGGTGWLARIDSIEVCGKTGTAQNPHGEDHSVFIAFAPKDNPQIAIAVYVENAGYGGVWAAPVASLMIEKYIKGNIANQYKEKRILDYKPFER